MALKRLPNDVQSLLCASSQINSYKRAIEELIYNSLDAKSTSIAIRIDIQESTIQVIDNGYGIRKHDFNAIGHRHMTSKVTDLATLKAASRDYGYRGEFIANIITVSQIVKVTSRHEDTEETWAKTFIDGKENKFAKMTTRPTKGTTVDIKGFLYNLHIQRKGIASMNEMQNIKSFLEQLSLVHNHISISLRDDAQNEIVFKIHKKRDIYQTLSTLFNVDKGHLLELQVEKHEYRVKGYIGKTDKELDLHWIFVNGRFIHSFSKLHEILNEYFNKSLHIKDQRALKSKKNDAEHQLFNQIIPFYFIFISCPYIDYDISYTTKQSVIQFKNWEHIRKLLQKLVKFYTGDPNLNKEIKKVEDKLINEQTSTMVNQDTRGQVKKIMDKILGNHSKKLRISQLQNGIKGKMVKRKIIKKKTNRSATMPKLFLQNINQNNNDDHVSIKSKSEPIISEHNIKPKIAQPTVDDSDKKKQNSTLVNPRKRKKKIKIPGSKKCKNKELPVCKKDNELKFNIISPEKNRYETVMMHEKLKGNINKIKDLDSVCKKSKIVAQKAELFLQNAKRRNTRKSNENNIILQKKYCATNHNIPTPAKINKFMIKKYIMNKLKAKSYKTTYDLVETVLKSQPELINAVENTQSEELYRKFYKRNDTLRCVTMVPKRCAWTNKYICSEYTTNDGNKERVSQYTTDIPQMKTPSVYKENVSEYSSLYGKKNISDIMSDFSERWQCMNQEEEIYSLNQNIYCTQRETSCRTSSGPLKALTYDSHQYHTNQVFTRNETENFYTINKRQNIRFITKESRDNFVTSNDLNKRFKAPFNKQINIYDIQMRQTIDESYTIEYSKSYDNYCNAEYNNKFPKSVALKKYNDYYKNDRVSFEPVSPVNDLNSVFGNTYVVNPSNSDKNVRTKNQMQNCKSSVLPKTYSVHDSLSVNEDSNGSKTTKDDFTDNNKKINIVFVSKSQKCSDTVPSDDIAVEPLNVCETVFDEIGSGEKEFALSFNETNQLYDSLYGNIKDGIDEHVENERDLINQDNHSVTGKISHHFSSAVNTIQPNRINIIDDNLQHPMERDQDKITDIGPEYFPGLGVGTEHNFNTENIDCNFEINFNLKNRPRFVPKGMSQIFENCRTKTACNYDINKDYYDDSIYNNFANDVQVNSEIYEPIIQNVEELTTKNIQKFQNKVKKDTACLVFDEKSLENAKVLGQADCKFIVAIMKKRCKQTNEASEYLILFDQHAVHERIQLENNLADYFNAERWTSVAVDNIILKMSQDKILYLHNYKDKFTQLGLQWTILNDNEVTVHSIPKAILGKNPREVEKVIKSVRNLIVEEINVIKLQKGCVSLYPKSIMDLVFSESCRYAIKFGDHLSRSDCVELLNALSKCKTPYQCAHGRPVMAVIMDIIADKHNYKINMEALSRFRQRSTRKLIS